MTAQKESGLGWGMQRQSAGEWLATGWELPEVPREAQRKPCLRGRGSNQEPWERHTNSPAREGQRQSTVREQHVLELGDKRGKFEEPQVIQGPPSAPLLEVMESTVVESCPGFKQRCILGPVVGGLESWLLLREAGMAIPSRVQGCLRNT